MQKSTNSRMLQQLAFHTQQTIKGTSTQGLDPLPLANNDHVSVLPFEMHALEPGETPIRTLNWNPLGFLSHIKRRTNDDRFPLSLWEVWFCFTLGMPISALIGPSQRCACNAFHHDSFIDHLQTCRVKSAASQAHGWVVHRLGVILGSVGHRVKIHKITPATGKEGGDLETTWFYKNLKNMLIAYDAPELDGALREVTRKKILHYHKLYINHPDPIAFITPTLIYKSFI